MPENEVSPEKKQSSLGLWLAPLAAPILFVALGLVFGTDKTPKQEFSGFESWPFWALTFVAVTVLSYTVSLAFGIPLVSSLRRAGKLLYWPLVSLSALLGSLTLAAFICVLAWREKHLWTAALWFAGYGAVLGFGVASSFWWITGITNRSSRSHRSGAQA